MAKTKKRARGGGPAGGVTVWGGQDHEIRKTKKVQKEEQRRPFTKSMSRHREAVLTHETAEKKATLQLRLHLTKTQREIQALKSKLTSWDPLNPPALINNQVERDQNNKLLADEEDEQPKKKKKGRLGPESWKLKGAARPAHEVYDFDTRYVDPFVQAHETARQVSKRSLNLLALYKGRLASELSQQEQQEEDSANTMGVVESSFLRQYLGLLMQLGHLSLEAGHYKAAREAWWECIELEGNSSNNAVASATVKQQQQPQLFLTTARESMIRMYLHPPERRQQKQRQQKHRHQQPLQPEPLWESAWRFLSDERIVDSKSSSSLVSPSDSVWIAYSRALVACKLHENNNKINSSSSKTKIKFSIPHDDVESCMIAAIRTNIFCAYYLAFYDTFHKVMEYTEDVHDGDEEPQTDLEEAIEYCCSSSEEKSGAALWLLGAQQEQDQQKLEPEKQGKESSPLGAVSSPSSCVLMLRRLLLEARAGRHGSLTGDDVEWKNRLERLVVVERQQQQHDSHSQLNSTTSTGDDNDATVTIATDEEEEMMESLSPQQQEQEQHHDHHTPDVKMYAGMFQTAMEMLQESGQLA